MRRLFICVALLLHVMIVAMSNAAAEPRPAPSVAQSAFETKILPLNWQFFVAIGRCEQPGDGKWGITWTHPGPTYPGGLGVFAPLWSEEDISGLSMASSPDKATPIQQMIQAQKIIDKYGVYAWGCTGEALAAAPYYE